MTVLKGNQPMSDLIVRSNSASPRGDKSQQIPAGVGIPQNGDQIEFKDILRILRRRRKLVFVTAGAVFALSLVNAVYQRNVNPIYAGSFTLLISDPLSDESAGGVSEGSGVFERLARNNTQNDIPTLIEVLRSSLFLEPVAKQLNTSAGALASRIRIRQGGGNRNKARGILKVTATGRKPEETRRLLKMVSTTYLEAAREQRQQRLSDGLNFLNQQAPELEARTRELQDQIAQFQIKNGLLQPTKEGSDIKGKLSELEQKLLRFEREHDRLVNVRTKINDGSITARSFTDHINDGRKAKGLTITDSDQALLNELSKAEIDLAKARSRYKSNSAMVTGLEERISELQPLWRRVQVDAVDLALEINKERLANTEEQYQRMQIKFLKQPELIKQYNELQARLAISASNLQGLVSARETFQLGIAQSSVPWRIIAPPVVNNNPIEPSLQKSLLQGILLALAAGIGTGLLRDRFDHVFHRPGEVKEDLGLPLLGHIPHVEFFQGVREDKRFLLKDLDKSIFNDDKASVSNNPKNLRQQKYQRFFYQEAFRNLFTSIRFLNSDEPLRSIALTSSQPAEGKSLINVLLAKTLSEMGQRVLLIDADLRKPQMHTRLGLNNLSGLSNLLTEDGQQWRDIVQNVPGYNNWNVITAGHRPPDPTRLLSSKRMNQLVKELSESNSFDLILFDTPPVLGLADAALVAEHCDGLMLLVSLNRVDRSLPKESVSRISSSGAPLLGVITNAMKAEQQDGADSHGQYSYSTYAHYADEEEDDNSLGAKTNIEGNSIQNWQKTIISIRTKFLSWIDS